jgi:hypothetical protein
VYKAVYPFAEFGDCLYGGRAGIAENVVMLGFDIYNPCDASGQSVGWFGGAEMLFKKKNMEHGKPVNFASATPGFNIKGPLPAVSRTTTGDAAWFTALTGTDLGATLELWKVTGTPGPGATLALVDVGSLASIGHRFATGSVFNHGKVALADQTSCTPAADTKQRVCSYVTVVNATTAAVRSDRSLALKGTNEWWPALDATTSGAYVVSYIQRAKTSYAVVATAGGPTGAFSSPLVVASGTGSLPAEQGSVARDGGDPAGTVWVAGPLPGATTDTYQSVAASLHVG